MSSLSFSRHASVVDMMPRSHGREGIFQGWKLQSRDRLQGMASDAMSTIGQQNGRWVHENLSQQPGGAGTLHE
jgi:hypothetical protein